MLHALQIRRINFLKTYVIDGPVRPDFGPARMSGSKRPSGLSHKIPNFDTPPLRLHVSVSAFASKCSIVGKSTEKVHGVRTRKLKPSRVCLQKRGGFVDFVKFFKDRRVSYR